MALPLLVPALTSSPAQVGFIAAAQAIPYLRLALPAGALIDHWDRKVVMILCDVARFLALGSVPLAAVVGHVTVAQLYLVALIAGTALVFFNIAQTAALTHVVPVAQLPRASALDQTVSSTAALIGPGLAGAIVAFGSTVAAGAALAFLVDSLSYLASVLSLLFIRIPFQQRHPATVCHSLRADIVEGLRFLWTHRRIRALALVSMASVLVYGSLVLSLIVLAQAAYIRPRATGRTRPLHKMRHGRCARTSHSRPSHALDPVAHTLQAPCKPLASGATDTVLRR